MKGELALPRPSVGKKLEVAAAAATAADVRGSEEGVETGTTALRVDESDCDVEAREEESRSESLVELSGVFEGLEGVLLAESGWVLVLDEAGAEEVEPAECWCAGVASSWQRWPMSRLMQR